MNKILFCETLVPYSSIKLSTFKILFSISQTIFIPLSRFPYHILQSRHPTELNRLCSVYCIIWSKTTSDSTLILMTEKLLSKSTPRASLGVLVKSPVGSLVFRHGSSVFCKYFSQSGWFWNLIYGQTKALPTVNFGLPYHPAVH